LHLISFPSFFKYVILWGLKLLSFTTDSLIILIILATIFFINTRIGHYGFVKIPWIISVELSKIPELE